MIWEALATESLGRPVVRAGRSTLPGASAHRRLLVKGTQTTLLIRLRFSASPWTTRTGLRKPGSEPVGSGRFAQYTWPWATTIRRLQVCVLPLLKWLDPGTCLPLRRLDSSPRLRLQDRDARCIRLRPPCTPGFVTSSADGTTARLQRKPYRESKSQFSYSKYNQGELHLPIVAVRADTVIRDVWGGSSGAAKDLTRCRSRKDSLATAITWPRRRSLSRAMIFVVRHQ
jgi:hypothetical protein